MKLTKYTKRNRPGSFFKRSYPQSTHFNVWCPQKPQTLLLVGYYTLKSVDCNSLSCQETPGEERVCNLYAQFK